MPKKLLSNKSPSALRKAISTCDLIRNVKLRPLSSDCRVKPLAVFYWKPFGGYTGYPALAKRLPSSGHATSRCLRLHPVYEICLKITFNTKNRLSLSEVDSRYLQSLLAIKYIKHYGVFIRENRLYGRLSRLLNRFTHCRLSNAQPVGLRHPTHGFYDLVQLCIKLEDLVRLKPIIMVIEFQCSLATRKLTWPC